MWRVASAMRRSRPTRASFRRAIIWLNAVASSPTSSLVRTGTVSHGPPGARAIRPAIPVTTSIGRVRRREKRRPWKSARRRLAAKTTRPRLVEQRGQVASLTEDPVAELFLEHALTAAVEDGAEEDQRAERRDEGAGEDLLVERQAAARGQHRAAERPEALGERRQERLE